jgi:threonine synthase
VSTSSPSTAAAKAAVGWPGLIAAYADRVAIPPGARPVTLLEGGTPLLAAPALSALVEADVWLKIEGANPTGSFKDRGMTVAVTHALASGARAVICASTGNTSASAAAYAARAGLSCAVLIPEGKISTGKLAQAVMYGAQILQVQGNFDDCLELARKTAAAHEEIALVNSVNPVRIEGQKTAAFEVCDVLGRAPDLHFLPVGNAGNITAYWKGYTEYLADGIITAVPRMFGFQASGAAPLVLGHPISDPETIATAIRIGAPASWNGAINARDASGGLIDMVTDDQILHAYRLLATTEGVFVEPASAASIAGLLATARDGRLPRGSLVVCTVTGHGLKDPQTALMAMDTPTVIPVAAEAVAQALDLT